MSAINQAELSADVVKELELMRSYAGLSDGWGGETSKGPKKEDLALIERIFLAQHDKGWKPMLGEDGKVGLYYFTTINGVKFYRDLEVEEGSRISLFMRYGQREFWHECLSFEDYMLVDLNPQQEQEHHENRTNTAIPARLQHQLDLQQSG